ncbi:alpha/beta fold hydrolase [Altererythrobacter salegens]|uniref:Alpha/beta fold hydrolase n=1 Tax=Croceibacterium salegens TaxID=1737568 RepID=A0A6I4T1C7_9SPHN|nr:alpha/beta hydrolase [Croceibacterium salegens]MXO61268.1 alpha/beta fold hydrolase [Croceibacterium salegens]
MTYSDHRYPSADGRLQLFARDYGGEGPPLLLMHGLTRNSADFEPLAAHLAPRYRLVVPDQRGRGLSDSDPEPANYRPDLYAQDMFALLGSLGIDRCGLIGTSMGGLMAMIMAAMQPARVSAVVLNDIGPELDPKGLARIAGYVGGSDGFADWDAAAKACASVNKSAFRNFGHDDWLAFARRTCREGADGRIEFAYDPAISKGFEGEGEIAPPDLWPLWDALGLIPVLAIRGAVSDLLSPATLSAMALRHDGPFASVEVLERGHAPLLDEPEALASIEHFLGKYWPA